MRSSMHLVILPINDLGVKVLITEHTAVGAASILRPCSTPFIKHKILDVIVYAAQSKPIQNLRTRLFFSESDCCEQLLDYLGYVLLQSLRPGRLHS